MRTTRLIIQFKMKDSPLAEWIDHSFDTITSEEYGKMILERWKGAVLTREFRLIRRTLIEEVLA